jgi:hypothetical protein
MRQDKKDQLRPAAMLQIDGRGPDWAPSAELRRRLSASGDHHPGAKRRAAGTSRARASMGAVIEDDRESAGPERLSRPANKAPRTLLMLLIGIGLLLACQLAARGGCTSTSDIHYGRRPLVATRNWTELLAAGEQSTANIYQVGHLLAILNDAASDDDGHAQPTRNNRNSRNNNDNDQYNNNNSSSSRAHRNKRARQRGQPLAGHGQQYAASVQQPDELASFGKLTHRSIGPPGDWRRVNGPRALRSARFGEGATMWQIQFEFGVSFRAHRRVRVLVECS